MPTLPRDPRSLADQFIDHELVNKSTEELLKILIIETRRLRQQLFDAQHDEPGQR